MSADAERSWTRLLPLAFVGVALLGAVVVGVVRGGAAVALWLAFATLAAAVLLFWESLRSLIDPAAPADHDDDDASRLASLESRKNAALRALKDIAFERSIGRLGDADYAQLEARYRAEARAAMASLDEGVQAWRDAAEALLADAERRATGAPAPEVVTAAAPESETSEAAVPTVPDRGCPACGTRNDADAVFCKRCGARVEEEVRDATA
ncbi:MAG: zinc ribbon domain-containing protein [Polyangiales bacterium]